MKFDSRLSLGRYYRTLPWTSVAALALVTACLVVVDSQPARATPPLVRLISLSSGGTQGNWYSSGPSPSADGRFIAFESGASNLAPGDTNGTGQDVFLRDPAADATTLITAGGACCSQDPMISADASRIVFTSSAPDLVPGDTNSSFDVFLWTRSSGVTSRLSMSTGGSQGNGLSASPSISADGRYIAFVSAASNLVSGDSNAVNDVFVRDSVAGTTARVSLTNGGAQANGESTQPAISGNGRYVAFASMADNIVLGDTNLGADVFVRDLVAGTTTRVSVSTQGVQGLGGGSGTPSLSTDGRYVAFASSATNLITGDTNGKADVFIRDRTAATTVRASLGSGTTQANDDSYSPKLSGDGSVVVFESTASNLVTSDSNTASDIFMREIPASVTRLVTASSSGSQANSGSNEQAISQNGRFVTFASGATNLVTGDTNGRSDAFIRDMGEKAPPIISAFGVQPQAFSPNGDGTKDTATFSASLTDDTPPIAWTLVVKNQAAITVRTYVGQGTSLSQLWDGKDGGGAVVGDGTYTATLTATDDWGNSNSQSTTVKVDNTRPKVSPLGITPVDRLGNLLTLSSLSITWEDSLSGIDTASLRIWLDNAELPVTVSGNTATGTVSGVAPGIHIVDLEGRDLAGNRGTDFFPFTLVSISGSSGTTSLVEQTVAVNAATPPSTVRFVAPQVDVSKTIETLNASSRVGHGTSSRAVSLGNVTVEFKKGALSETVTVAVPATTESHKLGTVAPSAGALTATIAAHRVTIPDVVVNVPVVFRTQTSYQVILKAKTTSLGAPVITSGPFLGSDWEDVVPVLGTIGACFAGDGSGVIADCQVEPSAEVYAKVGPAPDVRYIAVPILPVPDGSLNGTTDQVCSGCTQPDYLRKSGVSLALKCPAAVVQGRMINLCSGISDAPATAGPWAGFLNAWLYKEGTPARFPLWQQNHAQGASASCPNGKNGQVVGRTYRLVTNAIANDASAGPIIGGTWDDPSNPSLVEEFVYLGAQTGNSRPGQLIQNPSIAFQLSNQAASGGATVPLAILGEGTYLQATPGSLIDPLGSSIALGSATTNGWQYGSAALTNGSGSLARVQLITGSEFRAPAVSSTYDVTASLGFQFALDFSQC